MSRFAAAFAVLLIGCGGTSSASPSGEEPGSLRAPTAPTPQSVDPGGTTLTIASYNINFGNGHSPETVSTIASLGTDIVLLQETTEQSELAIRERLEHEYPEIRFHHCCRAGGLGVLSRWPITDAEILEPEIGFFPAWWLRVQTPSGPLVLVDVHLRPPISDGGSWVVGYFSTRFDRAREMAAIWLDVPKEDPVLLAGDFNEDADGLAIALLAEHGLHSALPRFHPDTHTWHWTVAATELEMMLDHVVYSPPLQPIDAHVVRGGLSDHEPVVVTLRWPDQR